MSRQQAVFDVRKEILDAASKSVAGQIKELEIVKRHIDDQRDALEKEELDRECSICGDELDDDDRKPGKCKDCRSEDARAERLRYIAEHGSEIEGYGSGRGYPR